MQNRQYSNREAVWSAGSCLGLGGPQRLTGEDDAWDEFILMSPNGVVRGPGQEITQHEQSTGF